MKQARQLKIETRASDFLTENLLVNWDKMCEAELGAITARAKRIEDIFRDYALPLITPKIKGEVTAKKLERRGVSKCMDTDGNMWFRQNNKRISPVFDKWGIIIKQMD